MLSLWSTSLTMVQPSPPSPALPISPISPKFNDLLELVHISPMELQSAIQTIMSIARTLMLHSATRWPEVSDPSLWPMAVQYATYLDNKVPDPSTGICPNDLLTKTRWEQRKFHDLHVWGCPLYVLDRQFLMARNFHVGNQELLEESAWVEAQIMQVLFVWFSTWTLELSLDNFMLSLRIGSLQLLPVLMTSHTSIPPHGPRCLETVSTNSSGMKMTPG